MAEPPLLLEIPTTLCEEHMRKDDFLVECCSGWKYVAVPVPKGSCTCKICTGMLYMPTINLHGGFFGDVNLEYAHLSFAVLSEADLSGANLRSTSLYGANLNYANLKRADLGRADLSNAALGNANLYNANLQSAHLNRADIRYANLRGADLTGADLKGANLYCARYSSETKGLQSAVTEIQLAEMLKYDN